MRKLLVSAGIVVFAGAIAVGATGAFFSDTETSTGNTFAAGSLDLTIDSVSHYNGMVCTLVGNDYVYIPEASVTLDQDNQPVAADDMNDEAEWDAFNDANPTLFPEAGTPCTGTWPLANIGPNEVNLGTFFNFGDIKPGDEGENTVSIHIEDNDAWMCAALDNVAGADTEETATEPEDEAEDLLGDITHGSTLADSELDENLHFFAWIDDGDNVFEQGEVDFGDPVAASTLVDQTWALADSTTGNGPIQGGETQYIGVYWCAGDISVVGNTLSCDGEEMGNEAQTDSWSADLQFYIEQARNNEDFECNPDTTPEPTPVTTLTLAKTVTPANVAPDSTFTLTATGPTNLSGIEGSPAVMNAPVTAGVYTLGETGGPAGAVATWSCVGNTTAEDGNSVTIAANEQVTCEVTNTYPVTQCTDGIDNGDVDVLVDQADPGCHTDGDANNAASYDPTDNDEIDGINDDPQT